MPVECELYCGNPTFLRVIRGNLENFPGPASPQPLLDRCCVFAAKEMKERRADALFADEGPLGGGAVEVERHRLAIFAKLIAATRQEKLLNVHHSSLVIAATTNHLARFAAYAF